MKHSTYSLKKLSFQEQQARYEVIGKFVAYNPFFAYLPYINNPTNNYQRYSNESLNSILLTLQYGNIQDDNDPMKKVYYDFIKDYQYNSEIYIREEQEKLIRYQKEQQLLAQQIARQYNANTQAISFNPNSNNRQNQREGGNRDERKQSNRDQYNSESREHQNREKQPREQHNYRETNQQHQNYEYGQQQTHKRREFDEKKAHEHQQHPQQHETHHHYHPNHEEHHLWHKFHTKAGDIIGFESKAEYDEFTHFKEKYGLDIKIKFEPLVRFESETKLLQENKPAIEPISTIPEVVPKVVSKPVIAVLEPKQVGMPLTINKKETIEIIETSIIKNEIKKMDGKNLARLKTKEFKKMSMVEQAKEEIVYNLNLIVPENLKDIEKNIIKYLFDDREACKVLIDQVIKKVWDQPIYASTYAKLCSDFCKKTSNEFNFQVSAKKDNPFKYYLIEKVLSFFNNKIEKFPEFESNKKKKLFLKEKKNIILSNVKFVAELFLHKILKKKIIKQCIAQLFESFLGHYYAFWQENKIEGGVYDFHFEAIIEFIESIGESYEELWEKGEKEKQRKYDFSAIKDHVHAILTLKSPPHTPTLNQAEFFTGDEYLKLLQFINLSFLREKFPGLDTKLQNLVEKRNNKQQKPSAAEGPQKISNQEIKQPINLIPKDNLNKQVNLNIENQQELIKRRHDLIAEEQFAMLNEIKPQRNPSRNVQNQYEDHLWHKFHTKIGEVIEFDSKAAYDEFQKFKEKYGLAVKIMYNPDNKLPDENKNVDLSQVQMPPKKKYKKSKRN